MKLSKDSEVYFVSEVLPDGEVADLTSLLKNKTSQKKRYLKCTSILCNVGAIRTNRGDSGSARGMLNETAIAANMENERR